MHTRRSFLRTSLAATTAILADVSIIAAKERGGKYQSRRPTRSLMASSLLRRRPPDYVTAGEVFNAGIVTQPKVIAWLDVRDWRSTRYRKSKGRELAGRGKSGRTFL